MRPNLSTDERAARSLLGGVRGRTPGARVPGSLPERILRFYDENPKEELTYADIVVKFGISLKLAYSTVSLLTLQGRLKTTTVVRRAS